MIELLLAFQLTISEPIESKILLTTYLTAAGLDKTTTLYCLYKEDCKETNPFLKWANDKPALFGIVSVASHAAIGWAGMKIYKRNKIAGRITLISLTVLSSTIAIHNHRQLNK